MKKTKLIQGFRLILLALENKTIEYNWGRYENCNCGIVTQGLLNMSPDDIQRHMTNNKNSRLIPGAFFGWSTQVQHFCSITGITNDKIFKSLFKVGLSTDDIIHLEYLSDKKILKRAKIWTFLTPNYHKKKKNLIKYLRAWIDILEEESLQDEIINMTKYEQIQKTSKESSEVKS